MKIKLLFRQFAILLAFSYSGWLSHAQQKLTLAQNSLEQVTMQARQQNENRSSGHSSGAVDISPFDAVKGKKEDPTKRDAFSKHYINEDGSYTALIGAGPIHYEKNGQFLDIDHTITRQSDNRFSYANTTNIFESYFGSTSHTGVKSKTAEGEVTEFQNTKMYWEVNGQAVNTMQGADVAISVEGDKAYYNNLFGSISAEFVMLTGKRELNYIIPNRGALANAPQNAEFLVFSEDVILPQGWTSTETESGILIKDRSGKEIYLYENPFSTDASQELALSRERNTVFETSVTGNILTVKTKVKTSWLLDSSRQFPVKVDPTVNAQANGGRSVYDDGLEENLGYFGRVDGYWLNYHIKFNTSGIPAGASIQNVTGYIFKWGDAGTRHNDSRWGWTDSADPTTTSGTTLHYSSNNLLSLSGATSNGTALWISLSFNNDGLNYVSNSINTNNYVATAFVPVNTWNGTQFYAARNHTETDKPYLSITYENPSCPSPSALTLDNISESTADISWTAGGNETSWNISWGPRGYTPGSPNATSTSPSYTISGLTEGASYDVYIRSDCGSETSAWTGPLQFTTAENGPCDIHFEYSSDNGIGHLNAGVFADDFEIFSNQMQIEEITIWTFNDMGIASTIMFYEDDNGQPGSIIETFNNVSTSSKSIVDSNFGMNIYENKFHLLSTTSLERGKYWLGIEASGTDVFWVISNTGYGKYTKTFNEVNNTWDEHPAETDVAFKLEGICISGDESFDFVYLNDQDGWLDDKDPNTYPSTIEDSILIMEGTATFNTNIVARDLKVDEGANLEVEKILKLHGDFENNGLVTFKSTSIEDTAQFDEFPGNISGTGKFTTERFIPARRSFRFLSSAVTTDGSIRENWQEDGNNVPHLGTHITGTGGAANGFDPTQTNNPSMFTLETTGSSQSWVSVPNTNQLTLDAGVPYRIMVRGDRTIDMSTNTPTPTETVLRATGALATGPRTYTGESLNDGQYFFIGNPYQAAVDIQQLLNNAENINPSGYYIWDGYLAGDNGRGAYVLVDFDDGIVTPADSEANGYLQPGQAILVLSTGGVPEVTFQESYKVVDEEPTRTFFSTASRLAMRLFYEDAYDNEETSTDGINIKFSADGNNSIDDLDFPKMGNLDENLAIRNGGKYFTLESRALPENGEIIPLFIDNYRKSDYVLEGKFFNIPDQTTAFLYDEYTGIYTALSDEAVVYRFHIDPDIPATTFSNRFSIHFEVEYLGVEDLKVSSLELYPNPIKDHSFNIAAKGFEGKSLEVRVVNMIGQLVHSETVTVSADGSATIVLSENMASGIYGVKIITEDRQSISKKLIKN